MTAAQRPPTTSRGSVIIDQQLCKGCELCIAACPPGVLAMSAEVNDMGYHFPLLHAGCTGCTACQMVCPDYVFDVFRLPRAAGHSGSAAGGSTPSRSEP